jgi:hypothetical protein
VAGVAFAFNGLTLNCLMWPNNIAALGWMPWVVLLCDRAATLGGRQVVLAAVVGGTQMLAGAPEIIFLTWAIVAATCLLKGFETPTPHVTRALLRLASVVFLVAALTAAQTLPFLELLGNSQRTSSFVEAGWSMPGTGWANFLVPLFRTFMSNRGVHFQYDQYWTSSYYAGIAVVALAVYAVWRVREMRVMILAVITCLALVLALGDAGYLHRWLRTMLPQIGFMRYPIKYVVPVLFCLPLLAAFAVRHWQLLDASDVAIWSRDLKMIGAVLGVVVAIIVCFARAYPAEDEHWLITGRNAAGRIGFLVAALVALHIAGRKLPFQRGALIHVALPVVLFLDVLTHMTRQNPTIERTVMERGVLTARQMNPLPRHGHSRAMLTPEADQKLRLSASSIPRNDYLINRLGLFSNCNLLEGIPKVNGFFSLYLREAEDIHWLIYGNTNRSLPALYDFLSVSQITRPGEYFEWQSRPGYLAMVTAGMKPVFADAATTLNALSRTNFDPRESVYLPSEARSFVLATNQSAAKILASRFTAHRADVIIEAAGAALVVVSQTHYRPWQAYLDDQKESIFRANHSFQAVQVPAGQHRIRLVYEDHAFHRGTLASFLALVICLPVWLLTAKRTP